MRSQSRRDFVCRTIPSALAAGSALALGPFRNALAAQLPVATRSYTAGRFALEIDGQFAGWLQTAAGGQALASVIPASTMNVASQKLSVPTVKYQDIVLTCGTGMSSTFYDWISSSLQKSILPRNGSLVACDFNNRALSQMDWYNSFISQIVFPACDVTSGVPGSFTIRLTPAQTRSMQASGALLPGVPNATAKNQLWLPSNFRLGISGLDCSRVTRIEAISATAPNQSVPSLVLTLPATQAAGFSQWFQASVIQASAISDPGRAGMVEYLASGGGTLFSLSFLGLTLQQLVPITASAGQVPNVNAVMSYKGLGFAYSAAACA
jgi:hypothetical protein